MKSKTQKNSDESPMGVVLGGVTYDVSDKPSHGVVRGVRKLQKEITIGLIKKHRDKFTKEMKVEEAMQKIFEEDPEEFANFTDANDEFIIAGTISLATNKLWTFDALAACYEEEIESALEKCKEKLGGDVTTFL